MKSPFKPGRAHAPFEELKRLADDVPRRPESAVADPEIVGSNSGLIDLRALSRGPAQPVASAGPSKPPEGFALPAEAESSPKRTPHIGWRLGVAWVAGVALLGASFPLVRSLLWSAATAASPAPAVPTLAVAHAQASTLVSSDGNAQPPSASNAPGPPIAGSESTAPSPSRSTASSPHGRGPIAARSRAEDPKVADGDHPASANGTSAAPRPQGASAGGASLSDLMRQAVGVSTTENPSPPPPPPAADNANATPGSGVTVRPSRGQVASAIGAVLPQARECFAPDDPISRADVVFASSGEVASMTVSGYAVGKPAEACVRAALRKARVPPFAQASFLVPVTIRP